MAARISEVCDGVLAFLGGLINPQPPDVVEGAYVTADAIETLDGKRVRVFPVAYGDAERLARWRVMKEYKVATVVEVPYLSPASPAASGAVPPAWVDDQIAWVEANVFDPLNTAFVHKADGLLLGTLTCWSCAVVLVYDVQRLAEEKVFASIVQVSYRESETG